MAYARRRKLQQLRDARRDLHRPSALQRGYGPEHARQRKRWERRMSQEEVCCARCGRLILRGEPWDLGHADHDRSLYVGPEHARCNRATAGRPKARFARASRASAETWL